MCCSTFVAVQTWAAANHSLEETQAEMTRLQDLAEAVQNIAEPKVTFRLIQVKAFSQLGCAGLGCAVLCCAVLCCAVLCYVLSSLFSSSCLYMRTH